VEEFKMNYTIDVVKVNGLEIPCHRIDNDRNGNPRYVVHFLNLGIELADYGKISGLTKYRAKWFGGGYVFQSYNILFTLQKALDLVNKYYTKEWAI
jgi:hypothetical protein